jgi:succinoglycan biosynthesis protein ExoM
VRDIVVNAADRTSTSDAVVSAMQVETTHICVCICTYKRPDLLRRSLDAISKLETGGRFTYSVLVVDNDELRSAEPVVASFAEAALSVQYCVEPRQSIALARNKALENANGDFIAFIDDDEIPTEKWLLTLFTALHDHNVDGVLGPVKPHFDVEPPRWVRSGKFYDRPSYPTGLVIDWRKGRTGNVLLKKQIIVNGGHRFRPEFRTGEDQDFFRRLIEEGHVFIWCHEALAYEVVPPTRWQCSHMLRRALLRGATTLAHPTFGPSDILKSMIAAPAYLAVLPFSLLMGVGTFMNLLVKLFDHLGKLLAVVGINPIRDQYITE